jgi:hypothetical protein
VDFWLTAAGGTVYEETGSASASGIASGSDSASFLEAGSSAASGLPAGSDTATWAEVNAGCASAVGSAGDTLFFAESSSASAAAIASGLDELRVPEIYDEWAWAGADALASNEDHACWSEAGIAVAGGGQPAGAWSGRRFFRDPQSASRRR